MEDAPTTKKPKQAASPSAVIDEDDLPLTEAARMLRKAKNADAAAVQQHQHHQEQHQQHTQHVDTTMKNGAPASPQKKPTEEPQQPFVAIAPANPHTAAIKEMAAKRGKPDAPKFLIMLYEILQNESDKVIRWTDDGLALQILEQTNVTEQVLPKYFNHTNFHSFQRQLNYFGFRKWTKSKTDICTFSHPYFRRNQPELMHLIKRKKATRRANGPEPNEPGLSSPQDSQPSLITGAGQKKLLPLSPSGKRRHQHDDGEQHGADLNQSTGFTASAMLSSLSTGIGHGNNITLAPLNASNHSGQGNKPFISPTGVLTNAISPASGGAKKKAKTTGDSKSFPSSGGNDGVPQPMNPDMNELATIAAINPQAFGKGTLPNLDIVRNRLIYRHPTQGATAPGPAPVQGFPNGFGFNPQVGQPQTSGTPTESSSRPPQSPAPTNESSAMFSNSFSDPVDILLRIKKSRTMSQDNTQLQSPQQRVHNQVEGIASLQNFLLTQSLYTNRLESQLKLALEENEALRHLVETKTREVEALMNERKMIQNENAVLTEDKNKLFEINRDLLSKLFPQ